MPRNAGWEGVPSIRGSTELSRMALLTFSLVGFVWGLEMTYCTPYLLELGLSKSRTSLVWVAGPLSGMIVAPIVGAYADRSRSKFGRRRPFMVAGSIVVAICLFALGWSKEILQFLLGRLDVATPTIFLAVFTIYALDFAINAVQFSCRSLIIDILPISQQQDGSAWAGRMASFGHLIGYGLGALDLESIFGNWIGDNQFKRMTVISALALLFTVSVTSLAVKEAVLVSETNEEGNSSPRQVILDIVRTALNMPERIRAICLVQFWAWIGWFPFMVYGAEWVGETYLKYELKSERSADRLGEVGKIGSRALIVFSIVTSIGSVILPMLIKVPQGEGGESRQFTLRPPASLKPVLGALSKWQKPALVNVWLASHFIFAGAMVMTPLASSMVYATTLVALCGIPWSLTAWACMTFMGIEINRLGSRGQVKRTQSRRNSNAPIELEKSAADIPEDEQSQEGLSGVYLGILNVYTTSAQFASTLVSSIVFAIFEPGNTGGAGASQGTSGIAVSLVVGAIAALFAARATWRLKSLLSK